MKTREHRSQIIRKYKSPFAFYILATLIPWALWFFSAYLSHREPFTKTLEWATGISSFVGLLAPVVIALVFILPDKELRQDFLGRIFNFRSTKPEYILIAVFLMLMSILAAQGVSLFFGYSPEQFQLRNGFSFSSALFPVWFLLVAAPMLEELAWHSYGTDSLVSRFNLFNASVIFAVFWAVWHFPLSFIKGYYHSNLAESGLLYSLNFFVSMIPLVFIMNWLYYKTDRNILLTVVLHISAGFFNEIFATNPMSKIIQTGLLLIVSAYLLIKDKDLFFKRIQSDIAD